MTRRGTGRRSSSMQVHPSDSFRELGQEPPSPTCSTSTALAEVNYAGSEDTLSGRRVPGAYPAGDVSSASGSTDFDARHRQRNSHIRMVTADGDAENNPDRIDSGEWRRLSPTDDQLPIPEMYNSLPHSESEHLRSTKFTENSRRLLLPSEVDSDQWAGISGPETNGDVRFQPFIQDPPSDEHWRSYSESGTEMWNNLGPHPEVGSDEWRRVKSLENNARMPPHELQSDMSGQPQWEPPSEPISRLVKRAKAPEPRQQAPSNPVPTHPASYGRPQHRQAELLPGSSSTQRRQAVGSGRPIELSVVGTNSSQHRSPLGNNRHAPVAPPGAPTGPRRGVSGPNRYQNQMDISRRDDRRVAFDLDPNNRAPRVEPGQSVAQTRQARRRTASGGNGCARQVSAAANGPPPQTQPSAGRAARQTQPNANRAAQPTVPIVSRAVQRTSPPAKNSTTQQQPPTSAPPNPQQEPGVEPPKRTRTRTRSKRKKNPVWTAVCSKKRYIITIVVSLLLLVGLLVGVIKFVKP